MASSSNVSTLAATDSMELPAGLHKLTQNLHNLVQVKLDNSNYVPWKAQMQVVFHAHQVFDFVSGLTKCPSQYILDISGSRVLNPDYSLWFLMDQHLKTCLYASISTSLLPQIFQLPTAASIWSNLATRYSSLGRSHVHQLKLRLFSFSKGNLSMQAYLDQFQQLTDSLAAAGECISDEDLILYILKGLPLDYESLRQSIRSRPSSIPITLDELTSLLITEEVHRNLLASDNSVIPDTSSQLPTILYTSHHQSVPQHKGRGKNNGFRGGRGGRSNRYQGRGHPLLTIPKHTPPLLIPKYTARFVESQITQQSLAGTGLTLTATLSLLLLHLPNKCMLLSSLHLLLPLPTGVWIQEPTPM